NQRRPSLCLRIEGELVRQLAVLRKKSKFKIEQLVVEFSIAECGIGCAENIYPMTNITFGIVVEADEHERFVFRFRISGAVVKLDELMVQHPFAVHTCLFHAAFPHVSLNSPIADEIVGKRILQWRRLGVRADEQE